MQKYLFFSFEKGKCIKLMISVFLARSFIHYTIYIYVLNRGVNTGI